MFFLQELQFLRTNAHFFRNIDAILSLFFRFMHQCTFCHITAKLAEAENSISARLIRLPALQNFVPI